MVTVRRSEQNSTSEAMICCDRSSVRHEVDADTVLLQYWRYKRWPALYLLHTPAILLITMLVVDPFH